MQKPTEREPRKHQAQTPSQMPMPPPCRRTSSKTTISWCGRSDMSEAPKRSQSVGSWFMFAKPIASPVRTRGMSRLQR